MQPESSTAAMPDVAPLRERPRAAAPRSSFAIDVPERLLARARQREPAALEQLYRWFEKPVFTLALRITGDGDEAAEALQETMLKLLGRLDDYRGGGPFWGWLRRIAVNEALMRLRRGKAAALEIAPDGEDDDDGFGQGQVPPPPEAADAVLLQRALLQLPAATRSVLWLYHAEGFTHEEIAAAMARTISFSKSQLARGTRRLRALLKIEEDRHG
mgnify:CR=1 FL=1